MVKVHNRTYWENFPSDASPVDADNLNNIENSVDEIDDRVIVLDTTKANKVEISTLISDISFEENTGTIVFTRKNGATLTLDTKLEKLAVNFGYDAENERLVITLDDGTEQYVDISALITVYEFLDSDTIAFSVDDTGKVTAIVKEGSIEEKHLQPNYLADIKVESARAEAGAQSATSSALTAESYVHGGTGTRENEDVDNAMYYFEQAKDISKGMNGLIPMGTITFAELSNEDNQIDKYMFNISENFTTDDTFREGAGHEYPAGVNVYRTSDGFWDCLAGNFVAGVKGKNESLYREGFVELTPEDIGALAEDGDSAENTVSFASNDALDSEENPLAWTDVEVLESGEKHSSIFEKVSTMFQNIRYLFKMIGTTDISTLGDGTITGTLNTLNTDLANHDFADVSVAVEFDGYWATVTNEQLGVDDTAQYVWSVIPVAEWHYIPFIYGLVNGGLYLRCWQLNDTTNGTVSLLKEGSIKICFKGIKIK